MHHGQTSENFSAVCDDTCDSPLSQLSALCVYTMTKEWVKLA